MKNKTIYLLSFVLFFFSCKERSNRTEYITLEGVLVNDSIYTRMPGSFFVLDDFLVWDDPFSFEDYIHYIDIETKKEVVAVGKKGQGPEEFVTPVLSPAYDRNIFIYDLNSDKQALLITDSVMEKKGPYVFWGKNEEGKVTRKYNIGENRFIELNPASKEYLYRFISDGGDFSFGKPFINEPIENGYDVYQGEIRYNKHNNKLVYSNFMFPYISIYNYDDRNNSFSLANEVAGEFEYEIVNKKELKANRKQKGCMGLTLSKDFIIVHRRDYETDKVNEEEVSYQDFDKLPHTVFLYDYAGGLRYIVNLNIPVLRIASGMDNNTLYVMGISSEYVIMEYELDFLNPVII